MTVAAPVPVWLAAWRERQSQPQEPPAQRVRQRAPTTAPDPSPIAAPAPAQPAPAKRATNRQGFVQPEPWAFDRCVRREPVLDTDHTPPIVVRRVGWQRCIRCRTPFFSEDAVRLRLCVGMEGCRGDDDRYAHASRPSGGLA